MRLLAAALLAFICLTLPATAQTVGKKADYPLLYNEALKQINLLQDKVERLEMENAALRGKLNRTASEQLPNPPVLTPEVKPVAKPVMPAKEGLAARPNRIETIADVPMRQYVGLEGYGGPDVGLHVAKLGFGIARLSCGGSMRNIKLEGERVLIYRDAHTEEEVYLLSKTHGKTVKVLFSRLKRDF